MRILSCCLIRINKLDRLSAKTSRTPLTILLLNKLVCGLLDRSRINLLLLSRWEVDNAHRPLLVLFAYLRLGDHILLPSASSLLQMNGLLALTTLETIVVVICELGWRCRGVHCARNVLATCVESLVRR